MKRNEGKTFLVVVVVAVALLGGCASVPSPQTGDELSADWIAEVTP